MKKAITPKTNLIRALIILALSALTWKVNSQAQTVIIPYQGTTFIPCGQNSVVQPHNANIGTYNNNADGYVVIDCGFNAAISLAATYTTEASFDFIRIYNGVGTGGTQLASYSGQNGNFTFNGTPGQTITVRFQSDGSVVYQGFNINVSFTGPCFAAPCAGTPLTNTVTGNPLSICPATSSTLGLVYTYSLNGLQYQWMSSTVSPVGPFFPVPNATLTSLNTPTLPVTTWFAAVVTCTNSNLSSTTTGQQVFVQGVTTNNIPYYEDFEGITLNNMLPNCSWSVSSVASDQTYISASSNNRVPRSGSKFASFSNSPTGNTYFYTNGLQLQPGITYSAGLWFTTEYFGYTNWTSLELLFGSQQTPAGLTSIAQVSPAVSGPYKDLGGLFSVSSPGLYYVAIRATGTAGSAPYLSWDDLSVTVPCTPNSGNSPTLTLGAASQTICAGDQIVLNATGADAYTWNGISGGSSYIDSPTASGIYTLAGTNTLTGCVSTLTIDITVNPTPNIFAVTSKPAVCPGELAYLSGYGSNALSWSNGSNGNVISVTPNATTIYSVSGTNAYGCSASATVQVAIKPTPTVGITSGSPNEVCPGDLVTLNATGAVSYAWILSSSPVVYQGTPLNITLPSATNFSVIGVAANGCSATATFAQNVSICQGISETTGKSLLQVYPNPATSMLRFEASETIREISFTDLSGRMVLQMQVNSTSTTADLSDLANGVYYVKVSCGNATEFVRIVKM